MSISCNNSSNKKLEYVFLNSGNSFDTLILYDDYNDKKDEYSFTRKVKVEDSIIQYGGHYYYRSNRIWFDNWIYCGEMKSSFFPFNSKVDGAVSCFFDRKYLFFGFPKRVYFDTDDFDGFDLLVTRQKQ